VTPDLLPRNFARKITVDQGTGCWIFTGALNSKGYGCIAVDGDGTIRLAHRAAYELLIDRIPAGMVIDHAVCAVKRCCNPAHLEVVTVRENNRRAVAAGLAYPALAARNAAKTHCAHGHEFSDENTRLDRQGWRVCVACRRAADRRRKSRVVAIKAAS
jgi:hypothetical protein